MYIVIEKIDFRNVSPCFNVAFYSKELELADRYAQCKRDEAKEKDKENYSYDVVRFADLVKVGAELNESLKVLEDKLGLKDVN